MSRHLISFCVYFLIALPPLQVPLQAKIVEVAHFNELIHYANADTLILLDIDDTLLLPSQMLGCDEWFMKRLSQNQSTSMDRSAGLEKTLAEWEAIRHLTQMKIVENGSEKVVKNLQKKGFTVMGLTTQGIALATRTVQQLRDNQIDLSVTSPIPGDFFVDLEGHGVLYRQGILFTSGTNKGRALLTLCHAIGLNPKRIVFINDKASHLREIEHEVDNKTIEFIGLRYAYADKHKAQFRMDVAEYQFNHSNFGHLLSDAEALSLMSR